MYNKYVCILIWVSMKNISAIINTLKVIFLFSCSFDIKIQI